MCVVLYARVHTCNYSAQLYKTNGGTDDGHVHYITLHTSHARALVWRVRFGKHAAHTTAVVRDAITTTTRAAHVEWERSPTSNELTKHYTTLYSDYYYSQYTRYTSVASSRSHAHLCSVCVCSNAQDTRVRYDMRNVNDLIHITTHSHAHSHTSTRTLNAYVRTCAAKLVRSPARSQHKHIIYGYL